MPIGHRAASASEANIKRSRKVCRKRPLEKATFEQNPKIGSFAFGTFLVGGNVMLISKREGNGDGDRRGKEGKKGEG